MASNETDLTSDSESRNSLSDQSLQTVTSALPLTGETVAFTGTLASMVHKEASRLVEQYGGRPVHSVSRSTSMLVVGEEGWPLEADGTASQKMQQAMQLVADGTGPTVISESEWLHLMGLQERRDEIQRAYTPAMLSRMLDVPVRMIRRWARLGLIRPVRRICRLPYFDFREVASARRLAALLAEGASAAMIEKSLSDLGRTLAGTDRSLAQLTLLVQDENVLLRDSRGVLNPRTGQRLLDFESLESAFPESSRIAVQDHDSNADSGRDATGIAATYSESEDDDHPVSFSITEARLTLGDRRMSEWNADEWFHEGCRLAEESEFESAVNAFRNSMSLLVSEQALLRGEDPYNGFDRGRGSPDPADVNFHLADALYRSNRVEAAIERYRCAIEFAPDFIEAWTQMGCLQAESEMPEAAEESLLTAISIHPGNPDALLHYAQLLDQTGRNEDALSYWQQYLSHDSRGPWADHARTRLEEARMASLD